MSDVNTSHCVLPANVKQWRWNENFENEMNAQKFYYKNKEKIDNEREKE